MPIAPGQPAVTLVAAWEATPAAVVITYRVTNNDPAFAILTFDGAGGEPGDPPPDLSAQVFVSFAGPDTVHVKRVLAPQPQGMDGARTVIPLVCRVGPRSQRETRLRLALPLRERSQYFPDFPGARYTQQRARHLAVTIGYLRELDGTQVDVFNERLGILRLRRWRDEQRFVTFSGPADVPVLVRQDEPFERI